MTSPERRFFWYLAIGIAVFVGWLIVYGIEALATLVP